MSRCPSNYRHEWWYLATGQKQCKHCGIRRYVRSNRLFDQMRISSYWKWRLVEYFALGVPAYRLRFQVPYSLKTIRTWYRLMRDTLYHQAAEKLVALSGTLEMDETMFGGKRSGKRGWGAQGKHMVFGIYQRDGKVITVPISSRAWNTLTPLIAKHTATGSLYYTDNWHAYAFLPIRGNHVVVRKEKGIPKGRDHLNGIEVFWSYAKHWLYPYRGVPKQYFHLYLKETEWRFNHRDENLVPLLKHLLNQRIVKER